MPDRPSPASTSAEKPRIETTVAHASRIYDYLLGGTVNFAVDRAAARRGGEAVGGLDRARQHVRAQRRFLGRAVRYMATDAGIRQFLDIGTGIPNADNVHRVAQEAAPASRIVYVDNDPIVLAHAHDLLQSTSEGATAYVDADLRDPDAILERAAATLDLGEPVAVVLVGILHLLGDDEDPHGLVRRLLDAVPVGSYLALSHMAQDIDADAMAELVRRLSKRTPVTWTARTHGEVARFLDGLDLVEPGIVPLDRWPEPETAPPEPEGAGPVPGYGAVGRKT